MTASRYISWRLLFLWTYILVSVSSVIGGGLYTRKSPVLQIDGKTYQSQILKSNYTTIIEFYAPWCGHCQNLKPTYEKIAKNLAGIAHVAAVNCDEDSNKALCSRMDVRGFPTLKILRPGAKTGRPIIEDYNGPRSASAISDAVVSQINNHVTKITDSSFDAFLAKDAQRPKAVLFTEKGTTTPLLRSLATDFLGAMSIAQIRSKEKQAAEQLGVKSYPTLVVFPTGHTKPVIYEGTINKKHLLEFLSQFAKPNPDARITKI